MDVIQFFIEVSTKKSNVITSIEKILKENSSSKNYKKDSQIEWDSLEINLKTLYPSIFLMGFQSVEKIKYFIFKQNDLTDKTKISLDILILSDKEDINHSINLVMKNLKSKFINLVCN